MNIHKMWFVEFKNIKKEAEARVSTGLNKYWKEKMKDSIESKGGTYIDLDKKNIK